MAVAAKVIGGQEQLVGAAAHPFSLFPSLHVCDEVLVHGLGVWCDMLRHDLYMTLCYPNLPSTKSVSHHVCL